MEKSKNFNRVNDYYSRGLWSIAQVHKSVGLWITPGEYKEITGEDYGEV